MGEDSVSDVGSTPSASTKKFKVHRKMGLNFLCRKSEEGVEPERVDALSKQSGGLFVAAIAKKLCFEQVVCKQGLQTVTPSAGKKLVVFRGEQSRTRGFYRANFHPCKIKNNY